MNDSDVLKALIRVSLWATLFAGFGYTAYSVLWLIAVLTHSGLYAFILPQYPESLAPVFQGITFGLLVTTIAVCGMKLVSCARYLAILNLRIEMAEEAKAREVAN